MGAGAETHHTNSLLARLIRSGARRQGAHYKSGRQHWPSSSPIVIDKCMLNEVGIRVAHVNKGAPNFAARPGGKRADHEHGPKTEFC